MKLTELVAAGAVAVDIAAGGRRGALEHAADLLSASTGVAAADLLDALLDRERSGTTGFGSGTAIPHGRVPGVPRIGCAILRLAEPVEWDAVDGLPVDLVFAMAGPAQPGPAHLKALAKVSRALRDKALVAKLRGSADAAALWAVVASADSRRAA